VIRVVDSRSKRQLAEAELDAIVQEALGARLVDHVELTDGMFNTAYRLTTADGRQSVLKVAPPPDAELMTYEHDLMHTETLAFKLMAAKGLPVPEVLYAADGLLLMTALTGQPWSTARERLTDREHAALRRELGVVVAALHGITGDTFGYPQGPGGDTWRAAFLAMVDAVLADATRYDVALPAGTRAAFRERAGWLDEVTTAVLVHFDLWQANIFIDLTGPRIEGIIDPERAFWGDPLAELATVALFDELDEDFLAGYRAPPFTEAMRGRLALYRAYLCLIMIVEGVPRGYDTAEHHAAVRFYRERLTEYLA
jgi:aminoglycoside phosphotransferase (APT) family kinase protein